MAKSCVRNMELAIGKPLSPEARSHVAQHLADAFQAGRELRQSARPRSSSHTQLRPVLVGE